MYFAQPVLDPVHLPLRTWPPLLHAAPRALLCSLHHFEGGPRIEIRSQTGSAIDSPALSLLVCILVMIGLSPKAQLVLAANSSPLLLAQDASPSPFGAPNTTHIQLVSRLDIPHYLSCTGHLSPVSRLDLPTTSPAQAACPLSGPYLTQLT